MKKRPLGNTGLVVSPLGLGTVKFGRNQGVKYPENFEIPSEESLAALLALAKTLGIHLLDTAPAYGQSEERLGRLLKGQRADWVIVGKAGEDFENGQSIYNFTPDHFKFSLERSLKALQTDYLDVFLIHSDGRDEEILSDKDLIKTLREFKDQKLVRAIGASTKTVEGGILCTQILDVVMASYHPGYTDEKPVLDSALAYGAGVLLKKALASGHIDKTGTSGPVQAAANFVMEHPATSAAVIGTINPDHLRHNARAFSGF